MPDLELVVILEPAKIESVETESTVEDGKDSTCSRIELMRSYAAGSAEHKGLEAALAQMQQELPFEVSCIVNGLPIRTGRFAKQPIPSDLARYLCTYHEAHETTVANAINGALSAEAEWESMPWNDRAAIFMRAAELVSGKYRYKLVAATMLGQGENTWQAELPQRCLSDFFRFGVKYVEKLYAQQPPKNSAGSWNRIEYRALEGFILTVSPFKFTAIGGNLPGGMSNYSIIIFYVLSESSLKLVGNTVVWKPSPAATYSNYSIYQILAEAGVPSTFQFTGSTFVFKKLWKDVAAYLDKYRGYLRMRQEGKNFYVIHKSAEIRDAVLQFIRGGFEYQGAHIISAPVRGCEDQSRATIRLQQLYGTHNAAHWSLNNTTEVDQLLIKGLHPEGQGHGGEVLIGGIGKANRLQPTVILIKDPESTAMKEEIPSPVITVYVHNDAGYEKTLELIDNTSPYLLTGSIFAADRKALLTATNKLRNAAGNVYYNENAPARSWVNNPLEEHERVGPMTKLGASASSFRREA
ncbi:Aldehyde/histidinol dehydrogenase [Suillus lakei]|nr:Aldehyde/histidinol dehydrogenase [Suillus lakei]